METAKTKKSIYLKLGYIIFFLLIFLVTLFRLFPYDKLKGYLEVKLNQSLDLDVTIDKMDFSIIDGIKLAGISVNKDLNGVQTELLKIDSLDVGGVYTFLLPLRKSLSVEAKLYDGTLSGWVNFDGTNKALDSMEVRLKDIDLSKNNAVVKNLYGTDISGKLNGSVIISDAAEGLLELDGEVHLRLLEGSAKGIDLYKITSGGMAMLRGMTLPDVTFTALRLNFTKEKKAVKIYDTKLIGNDINADVSGGITLNKNLKASSLNLAASVSLSESYLNKDATLNLLDQSFAGMKDSDGSYKIKLEGAISKPRINTI